MPAEQGVRRCRFRRAGLGVLCAAGLAADARAAEPPPAASPRASVYAVEKTAAGGAIVRLDGRPIAEYAVDRANKPFLWRILGPTGKLMTRAFPMEHVPGETTDHVHQRGLAFGHHDIGGFDTWAEHASYREHPKLASQIDVVGTIRHRGYRTLAGGSTAVIHAHNDILDAANRPLLAEERRMTFASAAGARIIDVDIDLVAAHGPVTIEDRKDAGLSIRVPDSMTVDRGAGGTIVTSEGNRDAAAWGKRAAWVDYHGPVDGEQLGIAILNHPSSFRHPTPWHVRTYGLFCANPFGMRELDPEAESGRVSLEPGQRISLRHRLVFHVGDASEADIAARYRDYAAEQPPPLGP